LIVAAIAMTIGGFFALNEWQIYNNGDNLKKEIFNLNENTVILNRVTPFEWEKVYFFAPYIGNEATYGILGFKWHGLRQSVSEGTMQVVFVKDNTVVCYCNGYVSTLGYFLDGKIEDDQQYKVCYSKDDPIFRIFRRENGHVYLEADVNS